MNKKLMGLIGSLMREVRQQLLENLKASKREVHRECVLSCRVTASDRSLLRRHELTWPGLYVFVVFVCARVLCFCHVVSVGPAWGRLAFEHSVCDTRDALAL